VQPDKGHRSNRLALGVGGKGGDFFEEIRLRPAYHGIMDDDRGYQEGAQLIFTEIAFRHYPSYHKLSFESLDVIDIVSLSPRDKFFHPISWKVRTGLTRINGQDERGHLVYEVNPGGGFAFMDAVWGLTYVMVETGINVGGALEHDFALGAGGSAGIIRNLGGRWKVHLFAKDLYYGLGDRFNAFEAVLQQNFSITADQAISVDVARRNTHGYYETETRMLWNCFF
jgi:hypothetical protein